MLLQWSYDSRFSLAVVPCGGRAEPVIYTNIKRNAVAMLDLIAAYENYLVNVKQASGNTTVSYLRDIRQFAGWLRDA